MTRFNAGGWCILIMVNSTWWIGTCGGTVADLVCGTFLIVGTIWALAAVEWLARLLSGCPSADKGGQNPPNTSAVRPPKPGGSRPDLVRAR